MVSKCPSCEALITRAVVNGVDLDVPGGKTWVGLAYVCPFCSTILGVQMDPIALKTDTVSEIAKKLR